VPERLIASSGWDSYPSYSPNGQRIVFDSDRSGVSSIWVTDARGRDPVRLVLFEAHAGSPRWSPDSQHVVFDSMESGNWDVYVVAAEGGNPRRLTDAPSSDVVGSFSRDGRWVYFSSDGTGDGQVWKVPVEGGVEPVQVTRSGGGRTEESWDGRDLYFEKWTEAGIWRVPVGGGEETRVLEAPSLGWTLGPTGIYLVNCTEVVTGRRAVCTLSYFDLESEQTTPLLTEEGPIHQYGLAVSPDEEWVLYGEYTFPTSELTLVENFR
jgi:Tol biopolymer transport system component